MLQGLLGRWLGLAKGLTHRAALPPLLPFNLGPDERFRRALQRAQQPLPHEDMPVTDLDLQFVASGCATHDDPQRPLAPKSCRAFKELKCCWEGGDLGDLACAKLQEVAIQQVTAAGHWFHCTSRLGPTLASLPIRLGERVASSGIRSTLWDLSTTASTSPHYARSVGGLGGAQPEDPEPVHCAAWNSSPTSQAKPTG